MEFLLSAAVYAIYSKIILHLSFAKLNNTYDILDKIININYSFHSFNISYLLQFKKYNFLAIRIKNVITINYLLFSLPSFPALLLQFLRIIEFSTILLPTSSLRNINKFTFFVFKLKIAFIIMHLWRWLKFHILISYNIFWFSKVAWYSAEIIDK